MSVYYSIGSIILGLIAWIVPTIAIARFKRSDLLNRFISSIISFGTCSVSLCLQFFGIKYAANIGDWSTIEDTINVLSMVVVIFIVITILLNILLLCGFFKKKT